MRLSTVLELNAVGSDKGSKSSSTIDDAKKASKEAMQWSEHAAKQNDPDSDKSAAVMHDRAAVMHRNAAKELPQESQQYQENIAQQHDVMGNFHRDKAGQAQKSMGQAQKGGSTWNK